MYREVLPFFGRENTIKASKEITVQFEKEDLASGRAMILHEKSKCDDLLGNFLVMCTTDTALCYFEEPRTVDAKMVKIKKRQKENQKDHEGQKSHYKKAKSAKKPRPPKNNSSALGVAIKPAANPYTEIGCDITVSSLAAPMLRGYRSKTCLSIRPYSHKSRLSYATVSCSCDWIRYCCT